MKKNIKKDAQNSKPESKQLTLEQALRLSSRLERMGLIITASAKKEIVKTVAKKVASN